MEYLHSKHPKGEFYGVDQSPPSKGAKVTAIVQASLEKVFRVFAETKFDFLLCISGVMEFDNTLQFFSCCRSHLKKGGYFLVTNDNVLSLRDRVGWFFWGKPRQYHLFSPPGLATWKILPIQNMIRILMEAGFQIQDIRFVPILPKDWIWLPLAMVIHPIQALFSALSKKGAPETWRKKMHPFAALLSRHYVVLCQNPTHGQKELPFFCCGQNRELLD